MDFLMVIMVSGIAHECVRTTAARVAARATAEFLKMAAIYILSYSIG